MVLPAALVRLVRTVALVAPVKLVALAAKDLQVRTVNKDATAVLA